MTVTPGPLLREGRLYQHLYDKSPCPTLLLWEHRFVDCNPACASLFGLTDKKDILLSHPWELSPPTQPCGGCSEDLAKAQFDQLSTLPCATFEWMHQTLAGVARPVEVKLFKLLDDEPRLLVAELTDIRQRYEFLRQLQISGHVYQHTSDGVMITDANNRIIDVNPTFTRITGYSRQDAVGQPAGFMKSGLHSRTFYQCMWNAILKQGHWQGEIWDKSKEGKLLPKLVNIKAIRQQHTCVDNFVAVFSDATSKYKHRKELEFLAYHDPLTHLANRTMLLRKLTQLTQDRQTKAVAEPFSLAFIDLDNFKLINDTKGHIVGDQVIKAAVEKMLKHVQKTDFIGRLSGDEFLIIFDQSPQPNYVATTLDKILNEFNQPIQLAAEDYYASLSIGVSRYPKDGLEPNSLIAAADMAMYQAKTAGGNRWLYYENAHGEQFRQQKDIEIQLPGAIKEQRLRPYFQPMADLRSGRLYGCEILARWQQDDGSFIPPAVFIPIAERKGLMPALSASLFKQACEWIGQSQVDDNFQLSFNVSAKELHSADFGQHILTSLAANGIAPHRLTLEITESCLIEHFEQSMFALETLRQQGITLAIDDFGTGFSSFNYLKKLAPDCIKIDKSFIDDLDSGNRVNRLIVKSLIDLAHDIGLRVVAEGVEQAEQLNMLHTLECDIVQGFYLSRPLNASDFRQLMQHPEPPGKPRPNKPMLQ